MIPGNNLMNLAFKCISKQKVKYYAVSGRTVNDIGNWVNAYSTPIIISGSFQPINTSYYQQLGLDSTKTYATWYDPKSTTRDIQRDTTGDKIVFACGEWICESNNDWACVDGWVGSLFVRVGDA